jgi:hypothetical protein
VLVVADRIYHLEFDPPPANMPGLSERLVMVTGPDNDTAQVGFDTYSTPSCMFGLLLK